MRRPGAALIAGTVVAAALIQWAAGAVYTGVKAASLPFNGPVEQYLSVEATRRIAETVDVARVNEMLEPLRETSAAMPAGARRELCALALVSACHHEVCRRFNVAADDSTGIDNLLESGAGVCFDLCGATYALALHLMRERPEYAGLARDVRWARGFVPNPDTLESSHSWLEAVGIHGEWVVLEAVWDVYPSADGPKVDIPEVSRPAEYVPLNWKQADLAGRINTHLAWWSILLARKNPVEEAVSRLGLAAWTVWPLKGLFAGLILAGAFVALSRRRRPAAGGATSAADGADGADGVAGTGFEEDRADAP